MAYFIHERFIEVTSNEQRIKVNNEGNRRIEGNDLKSVSS